MVDLVVTRSRKGRFSRVELKVSSACTLNRIENWICVRSKFEHCVCTKDVRVMEAGTSRTLVTTAPWSMSKK